MQRVLVVEGHGKHNGKQYYFLSHLECIPLIYQCVYQLFWVVDSLMDSCFMLLLHLSLMLMPYVRTVHGVRTETSDAGAQLRTVPRCL